jgi:hypothetical protein
MHKQDLISHAGPLVSTPATTFLMRQTQRLPLLLGHTVCLQMANLSGMPHVYHICI